MSKEADSMYARARQRQLDDIIERGFDNSFYDEEDEPAYIHIRCSQCDALVINGVATHERGCPNKRRADERERAREMDELNEENE